MNWVLALVLALSTAQGANRAKGASSASVGGASMYGAADTPVVGTTIKPDVAQRRCMAALKEYRLHYGHSLAAVRSALKKHAPELLRQTPQKMPRVARPGYGVLPALVPPRALNIAGANDDAHLSGGMHYSWDLTAQYAAREIKAIEEVDEKLLALDRLEDKKDRRALLKGIVDTDLPQLERGFELVDRHEKHNRYWQAEISANRKNYEDGERLFNLVREGQGGPDVDRVRFKLQCKPPVWVKSVASADDASGSNAKAIIVNIATDIADRAWLARFGDIVERTWSMPGVRIRVQWKHVVPRPAPRAGAVLVDEVAWVARFPRNGAVLTTGATATHALPCRAVVLGPFPLEESTAAHEFGHILGFSDTYIRGFRDLGPGQGLEILEIVSDPSDIMAMPESGTVQPGHLSALLKGT